jgi:hypothetical protein
MINILFFPLRVATFLICIALTVITGPLIVWLRANDALDETLYVIVE